MKILTIPPSLQPDGCDLADLMPQPCARCGHSEVVHELLAYWHDGACEVDGCACGRFCLFPEDEEDGNGL